MSLRSLQVPADIRIHEYAGLYKAGVCPSPQPVVDYIAALERELIQARAEAKALKRDGRTP